MKKLINYSKKRISQTILQHEITYFMAFKFLHRLNNLKQYKRIYIDVSIYAKSDNKTGIQRVVREVIYQILSDNIVKSKIQFVIATQKVGYRAIDHQIKDGSPVFDITVANRSNFIHPTSTDLFMGLDFCPNIVPYHLPTLIKWKLQGVAFIWLLYDLLPISNPEWFSPNLQKNFLPWLKSIFLLGDSVLCISYTVEQEAQVFANTLNVQPKLETIRLGQGFSIKDQNFNTFSMPPLPKKYVLMVGTLEPRKGHTPIIEAFHKLWQLDATDYALVLVGKEGWLVEKLVHVIESDPYYQKRLIWFRDSNDETLKRIYEYSAGVIIASFNEGYGLPLIEALSFDKSVFARDIPIFHEVANHHPNVTFFSQRYPLEELLVTWLENLENFSSNTHFSYHTWKTTWEDIKHNSIKES